MKKLVNRIAMISAFAASPALAQEAPAQLTADFVFEVRAEIAPPIVNGDSSDGRRQAIPITGGDFKGPGIQGEVLPGGADYQLVRPDGVTEVRAVYMIRTDDGALINVINEGIIVPPAEGESAPYIRTTPEFRAPVGKYDWLNKSVFLSNLVVKPERPGMVFVQVYRVK